MGLDVNPGLLGGLLVGAALASRAKGPEMPAQQAPEPAPQPSKRPDPIDTLNQVAAQAQATPGLTSTWLTGPQGVDPKTVKTTKTSLYGS